MVTPEPSLPDGNANCDGNAICNGTVANEPRSVTYSPELLASLDNYVTTDLLHRVASRRSVRTQKSNIFRTRENALVDEFYSMMTKIQVNRWENHPCPLLVKIVKSQQFHVVTSLVILVNVILIGIETDDVNQTDASRHFWSTVEVTFCILYTVELIMRCSVGYCKALRKYWMDLLIVVTSISDIVVKNSSDGEQSSGGMGVVVLRMMRLFKLARFFRLVRFVREIMVLVNSIASAMRTLIWTWVLLSLVIYGFSIIYTRVCRRHAELQEYFGTLTRSSFTLFAFVTLSWETPTRLLWEYEPFMVVVTIFFVTLTAFAIMNVVIAVIVESTMQQAMNQEDHKLRQVEQEIQNATSDVVGVFVMADADQSGEVSKEEFMDVIANPSIQKILKSLDLDFHDLGFLFDTLDSDHSGKIALHEFVQGTLQIRGTARARRLFELHCAVDNLQRHMDSRFEKVQSHFGQKLDALQASFGKKLDAVQASTIAQESRTERLLNLMENHQARLQRIEVNQERLMQNDQAGLTKKVRVSV